MVNIIFSGLFVLLGVIVGLSGNFLLTRYGHRLEEKAKRDAELRCKLETVIRESYKVHAWQRYMCSHFGDNENPAVVSQAHEIFPVEKIQTLTFLYFEEIEPDMSELALATVDYSVALQKLFAECENKNLPPKDVQSQLEKESSRLDTLQYKLIKSARELGRQKKFDLSDV